MSSHEQLDPRRSRELSLRWVKNPKHLHPFSRTRNRQTMIACMHPTGEVRKNPRVKIQTPGGGYSLANIDQILAVNAPTGPISIDRAILDVDRDRVSSITDFHRGCAFWKFRKEITAEAHNPSESTKQIVAEWLELYYSRDGITQGVMEEFMGLAGVHAETLPVGPFPDDEELLDFIDGQSPYKRVHDVFEPNIAQVYTVSHLPLDGQYRIDQPPEVQGYYDSLGAAVHDTKSNVNRYSQNERLLIETGQILTSAASREVIDAQRKLEHLEIHQIGHETEIRHIHLPSA